MSNVHPNMEVLKRLDLNNLQANAGFFSEDFVWHYYNPELPEMEGDYSGLLGLANFFNQLAPRTRGTFKAEPISVIPLGDSLVITLVKDRMVFKGNPMEIDAVVVWCIMEGMISEAWDIPILQTAKVIEEIKEKV